MLRWRVGKGDEAGKGCPRRVGKRDSLLLLSRTRQYTILESEPLHLSSHQCAPSAQPSRPRPVRAPARIPYHDNVTITTTNAATMNNERDNVRLPLTLTLTLAHPSTPAPDLVHTASASPPWCFHSHSHPHSHLPHAATRRQLADDEDVARCPSLPSPSCVRASLPHSPSARLRRSCRRDDTCDDESTTNAR